MSDDGTVTAPFFSIVLTPLVAMGFTAILQRLLAHVDAVDGVTAAAIRAVTPEGYGTTSPGGRISEIPSPNTAPEDVDRWWHSLSKERRRELIAHYPDLVGNLNGILVVDRNDANRRAMRQDLHRISDAAETHHVPITDVLDHPERFGRTGYDVTRYDNASQVLDGLYRSAAVDEDGTREGLPNEVRPNGLRREGFRGDRHRQSRHGQEDHGRGDRHDAGGTLAEPDAASLYEEANRADWDDDTAVVTWVGYAAPDDAAAASPTMAREGAALLAADVNALAVTHHGEPSHVTVVGHSYGSTTVADAAAGYGLRANDIVLIGCPGTDLATSAADFQLPPDGQL